VCRVAFRLSVAVSSLSSSRVVSPERKKMPGLALGTLRFSAVTVAAATVSGDALGPVRPFLTMLGLSTAPSRYTLCSLRAEYCAMSTFSVISAQTSMECEPLGTISGSTMGTRPFFWQMAA